MSNIGLIGKKIGMSREFFPIGISVPVTVIKIEKGRVLDLITKDKRGYDAIQVGFGKIKPSKLTKSMKGFYSKKSTEPKKYLKEYRVENISNFKEGNEIGLEIFKDVKFVDVTSKTIGKGFAGVMKRHHFSGLGASHGVSVSHRSGGSTGQRQDPGKVFKGRKMPGHMGNKFRTMLNLEVIKSDLNNDLIYLKGISFLPIITVKDNEYFDFALRRFKRSCEKAGVLSEVRRREFFEKPTWERKRKKAAAKKRHMKKLARENARRVKLY